ncbi:MAG: hypothetical protein J1E33_07140 [Alistipes sp.]|nr:hypothetical protein [Alistipes sp.]
MNGKQLKLALMLALSIFSWSGLVSEVSAQNGNYHTTKMYTYYRAGWRDSAFKEAVAGEQAGEEGATMKLIEFYLTSYGTQRNVARAAQLIEKWHTRSNAICRMGVWFYATDKLEDYLCKVSGYTEWLEGNYYNKTYYNKLSVAQSLKYARYLINKGEDSDKSFGRSVLAFCSLYGEGGVKRDLKLVFSYDEATGSFNVEYLKSYLRQELMASDKTMKDYGRVLNEIKRDMPLAWHYLVACPESVYVPINQGIWGEFAEEHGFPGTVGGSYNTTEQVLQKVREAYAAADDDVKIAMAYDYFYKRGLQYMNIDWLPDESLKKELAEALMSRNSNNIEYILKQNLCDEAFLREKYPEAYAAYEKVLEERAERERRAREERRIAMEKALAEKTANDEAEETRRREELAAYQKLAFNYILQYTLKDIMSRGVLDVAGKVKDYEIISGPHFTDDGMVTCIYVVDFYKSPKRNEKDRRRVALALSCKRIVGSPDYQLVNVTTYDEDYYSHSGKDVSGSRRVQYVRYGYDSEKSHLMTSAEEGDYPSEVKDFTEESAALKSYGPNNIGYTMTEVIPVPEDVRKKFLEGNDYRR